MIIDHVYENTVKKLTSDGRINDISLELRRKDNNNDRVQYVFQIIEDLNFFPSTLEVKKCEKVSTIHRNLGNHFYTKKDYFKAWQYYNLSLLHSPVESENYCIALSNRSTVLFALKKYEECIQDIDLCFSLQYPEKLENKLLKRKEMCQVELGKLKPEKENPALKNILTFTGQKSERYIAASTKLEVVHTKEMGRHVLAKQDIKVGEILVEEQPYLSLIQTSQLLVACNYCLCRKMHLIPCKNCCFALYCSEDCCYKAWKEYHSVECSLMPTLIDMDFTKLELLGLRTTIKARTDHPDWESLFKTIDEAEANANTEFCGHVKIGDKWIYDSKYYSSIHTLATNVEKRGVSDIFQKSVTAAVFLKFLLDKTNFLDAESEDEKRKIFECVSGLLLLHIMTSTTNMHGISATSDSNDGKYVSELSIASGAYAFHSLLNHSCAPNVVRFTELGSSTMKLLALRPIKKGMQVYDNYGSHHALESLMERQAALKFQYKFMCTCEACSKNWPMYLMMRPKMIPCNILREKNKYLSPHIVDMLQNGDRETAVSVFSKLCSLCEQLETTAPSKELCDCQEALKQCIFILQGLVPYGAKESIKFSIKS